MGDNKMFFILTILLTLFQLAVQQDPPLASLGPLASNIGAISGFSTGGGISLQFYLSHSSVLRGCAIFSGPIYECGVGRRMEEFRRSQCTGGTFNYPRVVARIYERVAEGLFDPLTNIALQKQYVSQGAPDPIVNIRNDRSIYKFLSSVGNTSVYFNETQSGHGYPTVTCGIPCGQLSPITPNGCISCSWSGAFTSLNYIYGGILQPALGDSLNTCSPSDDSIIGLVTFDQTEFFPFGISSAKLNMANTGYIYIPPSCRPDASNCTLLVHLHGCGENAGQIGTEFIKCSGVMAVAEANNIIVIFPQTKAENTSITAALGCWDYTGYTGHFYGTKRGPQIIAIRRMMERVLGFSFR